MQHSRGSITRGVSVSVPQRTALLNLLRSTGGGAVKRYFWIFGCGTKLHLSIENNILIILVVETQQFAPFLAIVRLDVVRRYVGQGCYCLFLIILVTAAA